MKKYLAIDIGGTEIKYGLIDEQGGICFKIKTEAYLGGTRILQKVMNVIEESQKETEIVGVGISTAGVVDTVKGEIYSAGPSIPNYAGTNFKEVVEEKLGLPCEVENDVNCAGLAEATSGAAAGYQNAVVLTIGTGIEGCILLNGQVLHGMNGCAGEVGRISIPGGNFEQLGSARTLVKMVAQRKNQPETEWDGHRVFDALRQGDPICKEAVTQMAESLGQGIANICYVVNPEIVVLGGGIMAQEEMLRPEIEKAMKKYLIPVLAESTKLAFAKHKNDAGILGAYYHFRNKQEAEIKWEVIPHEPQSQSCCIHDYCYGDEPICRASFRRSLPADARVKLIRCFGRAGNTYMWRRCGLWMGLSRDMSLGEMSLYYFLIISLVENCCKNILFRIEYK